MISTQKGTTAQRLMPALDLNPYHFNKKSVLLLIGAFFNLSNTILGYLLNSLR